jgi:hypothetical protein
MRRNFPFVPSLPVLTKSKGRSRVVLFWETYLIGGFHASVETGDAASELLAVFNGPFPLLFV